MHENFMRRAIQLATDNVLQGKGGPFGAVVVIEGHIIAEGANQVTATNDPTAHAEVVALRNACRALGVYELHGCTLYSSCEPCPMCLAATYWARIGTLFYGNTAADAAAAGFDDARLYAELSLPHAERALASHQLLREEAGASFAAWQQSLRRISY